MQTGGFTTQLQEMQITSPVYHPNVPQPQSSPVPGAHSGGRQMLVGSLPTGGVDGQHLGQQQQQQQHYSTGRPSSGFYGNPGASPAPTPSEYGTPASTWSPLHSGPALHQQTLLVNTGHGPHPGQQQQLVPGSAPSHSAGYPDLIMEDLSMQVGPGTKACLPVR